MTIVIVPPNTWHPIHTTGTPPEPDQPDHRMVTECYHTNPGNIVLIVRDIDGGGALLEPAYHCPSGTCGCTNYRLRTIPYEDHAYQQLVQACQPTERR